jgi:putative FmdB family regulatory protein
MPLFEYHCDRCDQTVERLVRSAADETTTHDGCGGMLTRVLSAPVTRAADRSGAQSGDTDSMRRFRENRTLAAEKKR